MSDRIISAIIISLLCTGVPAIYNICKKNKYEKEIQGKVYYGIFRIILLYIASIMSSEVFLFLIYGTGTIEGLEALILVIILSIPFMYLYLLIYKKYQEKKLSK